MLAARQRQSVQDPICRKRRKIEARELRIDEFYVEFRVMDDQAIVAKVWSDVQRVFPDAARDAHIIKSSVVKIPQSVYWPKPGLDHLRPTQATPIPNLFLAGGYTQQRFYDSMEGAVSSGRRAARALLSSHSARSAARPSEDTSVVPIAQPQTA